MSHGLGRGRSRGWPGACVTLESLVQPPVGLCWWRCGTWRLPGLGYSPETGVSATLKALKPPRGAGHRAPLRGATGLCHLEEPLWWAMARLPFSGGSNPVLVFESETRLKRCCAAHAGRQRARLCGKHKPGPVRPVPPGHGTVLGTSFLKSFLCHRAESPALNCAKGKPLALCEGRFSLLALCYLSYKP